MCGVLGLVNVKLKEDAAMKAGFHRGPDEQRGVMWKNVTFFHFRLSILDHEGGNQPMEIGNHILIYNGEIYNAETVANKLSLKRDSYSDTEVLLRAYILLGSDCLELFDGMFAFAILNKSNGDIVLGRDRAGKKPLYYYFDENRFCFASELNLLASQVKLKENRKGINGYLFDGLWTGRETCYDNVYRLMNGEFLKLNYQQPEKYKVETWWSIDKFYLPKTNLDFNEAKAETLAVLRNSVRSRLLSSDLEVGCFLSGGIDSGLVTAIASEFTNSLKTFTVRFDGAYDESSLAKLVSDKFGTAHNEIEISYKNLASDFESIIKSYGEPFADSSSIPSYYVAKEAKKHVTVILNGDGADELFGGYRRYALAKHMRVFTSSNLERSIFGILNKFVPYSNDKKSKLNYLKRALQVKSSQGTDAYKIASTNTFTGLEKFFDFEHSSSELNLRINHSKDLGLSDLDTIMNVDFHHLLFTTLLVKIDIACMTNSVEGRSPFLSKGLLEFAPSLPDNYKIKGTKTKYVLREIARQLLPNEIFSQPKRGFEVPIKSWVDGELKDIVHDRLGASTYIPGFFKDDFVSKLLNRKLNISEEKRAKIIFKLLSLEIWKGNN